MNVFSFFPLLFSDATVTLIYFFYGDLWLILWFVIPSHAYTTEPSNTSSFRNVYKSVASASMSMVITLGWDRAAQKKRATKGEL